MLLRIFYLFTQLYDFREKALVIVPSESQWLVTYISDGSETVKKKRKQRALNI